MKLLFLTFMVLSLRAEAFEYSDAKPAERAKVESAMKLLGGTPTGAAVLKALQGFAFSIEITRSGDGNGSYDDEYKILSLNAKSLAWPEWKLARLLCHELTHAVQDSIGINRANYGNADPSIDDPISEYAALSMEVRFWVEAGQPADSVRDFNMLRRAAYLHFPETVRVGWAYTNSLQRFKEPLLAGSDERLASYWESVLSSEAEWRARWAAKFPKKDSAIALEYLKERYKKPVSKWLPDYLEKLGDLPGTPSANDLELIRLHRFAK
jgi:hypothetical protein